MLSLSQFRHHLFPAFMLMKGTGATFEVIYKGKVYDVNVRKSEKKPVYTRAKRAVPISRISPHGIDMDECPKCGYVMASGTCLNTKCT